MPSNKTTEISKIVQFCQFSELRDRNRILFKRTCMLPAQYPFYGGVARLAILYNEKPMAL